MFVTCSLFSPTGNFAWCFPWALCSCHEKQGKLKTLYNMVGKLGKLLAENLNSTYKDKVSFCTQKYANCGKLDSYLARKYKDLNHD